MVCSVDQTSSEASDDTAEKVSDHEQIFDVHFSMLHVEVQIIDKGGQGS